MQQSNAARTETSCFLCYDLRAIQSFIFRVPKLKYIVGGSALVDRFDRSPRTASPRWDHRGTHQIQPKELTP